MAHLYFKDYWCYKDTANKKLYLANTKINSNYNQKETGDSNDSTFDGWLLITAPGFVFPEDCEQAFYKAKWAKYTNSNSWNFSNTTNFKNMFNGAVFASGGLPSMSGWNMSKATNLYGMFQSSNITSFSAPNWNLAKATSVESMFANCTSLTTVSIENWKIPLCYNYKSMFDGCTALKTMNLSTWTPFTYNPVFTYMFRNCKATTNMFGTEKWKMPASVSVVYSIDFTGMYYNFGYTGVANILWDIKYGSSYHANMTRMFLGAKFTLLHIDKFLIKDYDDRNYMCRNMPNVLRIYFGNVTTSNTSSSGTASGWFEESKKLERVYLNTEKNYNTVYGWPEDTTVNDMFKNCTNIYNNGHKAKVGYLGGFGIYNPTTYETWDIYWKWDATNKKMLFQNKLLTGYKLFNPHITPDDATWKLMNSAPTCKNRSDGKPMIIPIDCANLFKGLSGPNNTTVYFDFTQYNCEHLLSLVSTFKDSYFLPKINPDCCKKLAYVNSMYADNPQTILDITDIDKSHFVEAKAMFKGCKATDIVISIWNCDNDKIYVDLMFNSCSNLERILLKPNSKPWNISSLRSENMFTGSTKLPEYESSIQNNADKYGSYNAKMYDPYTSNQYKGFFWKLYSLFWRVKDSKFEMANEQLADDYKEWLTTDSTTYPSFIEYEFHPASDGKLHMPSSTEKMFYDVHYNAPVDISKFDFSQTINTSKMFEGATFTELTGLAENTTTLSVKDANKMFYNMDNILALDLSKANLKACIDMSDMFGSMDSIVLINLLDITKAASIKMDGMFANDPKLEKIMVEEGADWKPIASSSTNMFVNDPLLPLYDAANVDSNAAHHYGKGTVNGYFYAIGPLYYKFDEDTKTITFTNARLTTDYVIFKNQPYNAIAEAEHIIFYPSMGDKVHVPENGSYMFYGCKVPQIDCSMLDTLITTDMSYMFANTTSDILHYNKMETSLVLNFSNMFFNCTMLNLGFGDWDVSSATSFLNFVAESANLKKVNLGDFNIELDNINFKMMFANCPLLKEIHSGEEVDFLPHADSTSYRIFYGSSNIELFDKYSQYNDIYHAHRDKLDGEVCWGYFYPLNDKQVYIKINGEWILATPYVKIDGEWKIAEPYVKVNDEWKISVK